MKFIFNRNINAVLLTILVHLVIVFFFFATRLNNMKPKENRIELDLRVVEPKPEEALQAESKQEQLDKMADAMISNQIRHNVGVNTADKLSKEISTEDFAKQVQNDLDAAKNHLEGVKSEVQQNEDKASNELANDKEALNESRMVSQQKSKTKAFKGVTNIYYSLTGRRDMYLPVPVYKCQGNGRIVVNVSVSQRGEVVSADIDRKNSDSDDCLFDAALNAAKHTFFNPDYAKAPERQKGSITYLFVAQ